MQKYEMIAHSWKLNIVGKQACNTCGLIALNNDFTRWAIDKGCNNQLHSDHDRIKKKHTNIW